MAIDPKLAEAIEGLEDRAPKTDLWPGIARRIRPPKRRVILGWPAAIAAGLVLVAGGAVVGRMLGPGAVPTDSASVTTTAEPDGLPILTAGFQSADATLNEAIDRVEMAYLEAAPSLDAEARASISAALAALDTAITEARSRAASRPGDVQAARYLTRTMQRKLGVLQRAATLASKS
ncbi:MAG TPA: hypothetical protein PLL69_08795 [Gemmatimonadales bacterium]|nr:hypothetical protein [Gemmatimonadales bacterium]